MSWGRAAMNEDRSLYAPNLAVIDRVVEETADTKTFRAVFRDEDLRRDFAYHPGQFQEISVFGVGEATFCLTSSPTRPGAVEFSVKRVGAVTSALHEMEAGGTVGIRGPYGNWFPHEDLAGKNLVFVGGGIGMAPLRSLLTYCLDRRSEYGHIDIFYGARTPDDLCYTREFDDWRQARDTDLYLTVDRGNDQWTGYVGVVPAYVKKVAPSPANAVAITCGPPVMIKFTLPELQRLGFADEQILTTLEMRMKCGVGKCGRCNIGHTYVCLDGPVFTYAQIRQLAPEF
jgi:sulfhydrogenase subunit gamma (sulfur reductase)